LLHQEDSEGAAPSPIRDVASGLPFRELQHSIAQSAYPASVRYNGVLPKVTFLPANETFEFESGKLPYKNHGKPESLLDVAMNFGFHLEHACGGSCACTTCHVVVKQGVDNLSAMEDDEFDRVEQASDFQLNSRLGCQAIVKGDVTVHIPAWNRNYVSEGH
jgi:2Fe-2S ferredoxin